MVLIHEHIDGPVRTLIVVSTSGLLLEIPFYGLGTLGGIDEIVGGIIHYLIMGQ